MPNDVSWEKPVKAMLVGLLAAMAAPGAAQAADHAGTWAVKAEFGRQFKYTLLCTLSSAGDGLAGPCSAFTGRTLRTTGYLNGNSLRFAYDTDFNGAAIRLDYVGRLQPNGAFRGAVETRTSQGVFEARRVLDPGPDQLSAWKLDVGFSAQMRYGVFCGFKADGARLRGPCAIAVGETLPTKGAADASTVTFAYDTVFQGQPTHVVYTGAVQPDGSLKGTITSGGGTGTFTATKQ